jgi:hypothetical protein
MMKRTEIKAHTDIYSLLEEPRQTRNSGHRKIEPPFVATYQGIKQRATEIR